MTAAAPKLLKARQNHTRWFVALLVPVLVFGISSISPDALLHELMDWCGYFLVIFCVLGRAYSSAYIGGIKNEVVVRQGPFSIVRNPLYVFSFLGVVGIGLQSGMFTVLIGLVAVFVLYYRQVVQREEAFLLNKFGEDYARYLQEVPRWFPKFSLWNEPAEVTVRPYFLRNTMTDALIFFLPLPVFELLEDLHSAHIINTFISLP